MLVGAQVGRRPVAHGKRAGRWRCRNSCLFENEGLQGKAAGPRQLADIGILHDGVRCQSRRRAQFHHVTRVQARDAGDGDGAGRRGVIGNARALGIVARQPALCHQHVHGGTVNLKWREYMEAGLALVGAVVQVHRPGGYKMARDGDAAVFDRLRIGRQQGRGRQCQWRGEVARFKAGGAGDFFIATALLPLRQRDPQGHQ